MAKYYGNIGYVKTVETVPGVWVQKAIDKPYYGEVIRDSRSWQPQSEGVNDDININNSISIVADPYARQNYPYIKYLIWNDIYWEVTDITISYPRIILNIGGVYNGEKAEAGCGTPCTSEN